MCPTKGKKITVQPIVIYGDRANAKAVGSYYGTTLDGINIVICNANKLTRSTTSGITSLEGRGINPISKSEFDLKNGENGKKYCPSVIVYVVAVDPDGWIFQLLKTMFCERRNCQTKGNPMVTLNEMKQEFVPENYASM